MGPFELLDYVGLDTTKFILEGNQLSLKSMIIDTVEVLNGGAAVFTIWLCVVSV